ncbi:MAG: hypothetical protein ACKVSF_00245 [Alphaproteobacteria bacterium]
MSENEAIARVRSALETLARGRRTITYKELVELAAVPEPQRIHRLTLWLEGLARADHEAGAPLLAALAVSRVSPGIPGRGFFQLIAALGRYSGPEDGAEAARHHAREIERVYAAWSRTGQGGESA